MQEVYILSAMRTPIGSFGGSLSSFSATQLGSIAIQGALEKSNILPRNVEEVFMGNVISANLGQAPARQAAIFSNIGYHVPCTTINKVCASGAKAVMLASQAIRLGQIDIAVAGGMENMSSVPYYLPNARYGYKYGNSEIIDGLSKDGLTDVYHQKAMGVCGDNTAKKYDISRKRQDAFAVRSYQKSSESTQKGFFKKEIIPVEIPQRKGKMIPLWEDEEYKRVKFEKIPNLKPAFSKDGTVTAANASTINDGAAALVLASGEKIKELSLEPLARIIDFTDVAQEPEWFTTSPSLAAKKVLKMTNISINDINFFEINEAFSVVPLVFMDQMDIPEEKVNVFGGAVSLGHPIGASGARILVTLINVLYQKKAKLGMIAICNGGGGASAIIIEKM